MKKLLFICVFFSALKFTAQTVNLSGHDYSTHYLSNIVNIGAGSYYSDADCCGGQIRINKVSAGGQAVFSSTLALPFPYFANFPKKLIQTKDHKLLLMMHSYGSCDTGPEGINIVKLDTTGAVIFAVTTGAVDMTQHSDSSYYMIDGTQLIHYSKTGQLVSTVNTGFTGLSAIAALANGHLLVHSGTQNNEITTTNSLITQQTESSTIVNFKQTLSGNIYGLTNTGALHKYNSSLSLTASSATMTPAALVFTDLIERNDSLFATGTNTVTNTPFYSLMDQNFNVLYITQAAYKNVMPKGIAINHNKINIITAGSSVLNTDFAIFKGLYQFSLTGSFVSSNDIGVVGISVSSSTFSPSPYNIYNNVCPVYSQFELSVTVKNYGDNPVTSFYLSDDTHHNGSITYCDFFHKGFTATIPPHGTVVVQTGLIYGPDFGVHVPTQASDIHYVNLCLFTTVPNESNDVKIDNDAFCDSVVVTGITVTGIQTNSAESMAVSLFPNPFTDQLRIQSDLEIKQLEVYNTLGVLKKQLVVNKRDVVLDNFELPAGIYFIKVKSEKGSAIQKIIKE